MSNTAILLLGSNMGNKEAMLWQAKNLLKKYGNILMHSAIYKTAAWGNTQQDEFYNQAIIFQTILSSQNLLQTILHCEAQMGRKRHIKWEPRVIDIDIIFYNNDIITSSDLTIPHPQMQLRNFVLKPIAELVPDYVHPVLKKSIKELLIICPDRLKVEKL
jgi:2-amino-4-hydroxy-6-hydroxymethyldihydropteridine diphosphokinase